MRPSLALTLSLLLSIPSLAIARPTLPIKRTANDKLCRPRSPVTSSTVGLPTPQTNYPSSTVPTVSEPESTTPPSNDKDTPPSNENPPSDEGPEDDEGGDDEPETPEEEPKTPDAEEPENPGDDDDEPEVEDPPLPPPEPTSGLASQLFPPGYVYSFGFTTAEDVVVPGVRQAELNDKELNVFKVSSGMTHNVVEQEGKTAWEAFYPAGSYKPSASPRGGFGFYVNGTNEFEAAVQGGAEEVVFGYSVMFEEGFNFVKGGKLPGAYGGIGNLAYGCSGGRQEERAQCFDLRLMWRTEGAGELYTYLPLTEQNQQAQAAVPPQSIVDSSFGYSVGRGSFYFPPGEWVTVAERVKLNTPGEHNGEVQLWVNGELTINLQGVSLRDSLESVVFGYHFQTFFGGGSEDWATPTDQTTWFADVSGAVIVGRT